MVSYTPKPESQPVAHVSDTGIDLMGISYNLVYGAFKSTFVVTPISPPSPILIAPNRASGGFPFVLIGNVCHLESQFRDLNGAR